MLPELLISKFKMRLDSRRSKKSNHSKYLHSSRRRYLVNSIPLLSIVALLVGNSDNRNDDKRYTSSNSNPTHVVWWRSQNRISRSARAVILTRASQVAMTPLSRIRSWMDPYSRMSSWKKTTAFTILLLGISFLSSIMLNSGSCSAVTSASLELSTNKLSGSTVENGTAIASTDVKVVVSDALDYSLILKVDNTGLTNGSTTINAGNVVDDNTWGYKWDTETSYTAPSTSGKNLTVPALANNSVNFTKTLTFGAKFGSDATAGTYSASGTLSLVATTLSSTKPTRTNYTFLGWSTSSSATTASYSAGGSITLRKDTTLYAVWEILPGIWSNGVNSGITYMQDITTGTSTSSFCSSNIPVGSTITLKDNRTYPSGVSKTYTIRKMGDGKCWMTQNLRLTGSSLTSSNSNVNSDYPLPTSNISSFNTSATTQAAYYDPGTDTSYYTWCAATANTCGSFTTNGANSTYNICPKNWTLPTGRVVGANTANDFYNLFKNMGLTISGSLATSDYTNWGTGDLAITQGSPYNFAYTGRVSNGAMGNTSYGYWWSRTAFNSNSAYLLYIDDSSIYPGTTRSYHYLGIAVRCVAQ